MSNGKKAPGVWLPATVAALAIAALALWWSSHSESGLKLRIPGTDAAPAGESGGGNPVLSGKVSPGAARAGDLPGDWQQFRGPNRDGIATNTAPLARDWKSSPPRELWALDLGEGYAGAAVRAGRVFVFDYDRDLKQSILRCLSLADGKEIWRFSYPLTIKRNHGMTRTVPAVTDKLVIALDSKCNVFALDVATGELKWTVSLVREFGAAVPEWYAGQCPLVDDGKVILAPGGKNASFCVAVRGMRCSPRWQRCRAPSSNAVAENSPARAASTKASAPDAKLTLIAVCPRRSRGNKPKEKASHETRIRSLLAPQILPRRCRLDGHPQRHRGSTHRCR